MSERSERDRVELVPILRTADRSLLIVVKSLLDAAEIPYLVRGEVAMGLLPLGRFGLGVFRPVLGATILVPAEWEQETRDLLRSGEGSETGETEEPQKQ